MTWSDTFLDVFKKNDVRFISYVPDNVLTPLIKGVTSRCSQKSATAYPPDVTR